MDNNFTDTLVQEYTLPEVKPSQLYNLEFKKVPDELLPFMKENAEIYAANGHGYEGKNYSDLYHTLQINVNANADETIYLYLINNNESFVKALNQRLLAYDSNSKIVTGHYDFNLAGGATNHDKFEHLKFEKKETVVDLLRKDRFNENAIWSIEIKSGKVGTTPTSLHKTDVCLQHILGGTRESSYTEIWISTEKDRLKRADNTYIKIGSIMGDCGWKNIRIDSITGEITPWYAV